MLNPVEEEEVGDSDYSFEGGDEAIIAQVTHEEAIKCGEILEIESDEEDSEQHQDAEMGGTPDTAVDLSRRLRQFRITMRRMEGARLMQPTLGRWFGGGVVECD